MTKEKILGQDYASGLFLRQEKKSTKINFLGPETARWSGGLPREGVVAENFAPSREILCSLGFKERNPRCPGNFAGMSRTPGVVQKVCAKKVRAHFSFPIFCCFRQGVAGMSRDLGQDLSGTESAILSRESCDSESCNSNRAIPRSL